MNDREKFIEAFKTIKAKGFILSNREGNTAIGKTLEDVLGVEENNLDAPDLHGFEIKGQRAYTGSYVTLFTRAPTMPKGANTILRDKYGTPDKKTPHMKVLHTSMFHTHFNNHKSGFGFKLRIDRDIGRIYFDAVEKKTDIIQNDGVYWSFDVIKLIIENKLKNLVFVQAATDRRADGEYFHFNRATMYFDARFEKFLDLIEKDYIRFDIRIGVFRKGKNAGKVHDHGSAFRLKKENFSDLFLKEYAIK